MTLYNFHWLVVTAGEWRHYRADVEPIKRLG